MKREVDAGNKVAVVVSAMSGVTNQLVAWVREASVLHDAREYDAVVATGEQVTSGLLAIVLQAMGLQARSWQGWQIPINTSAAHGSARITGIDGAELKRRFKEGEVAVVTGFQGIEPERRPHRNIGPRRLGYERRRHGRRTQAPIVCDIYTDVDGVYTTDPRIVPKARRLPKVSYEEMLEMASLGLQGAADALRGARHGQPDAGSRVIEFRGARGDVARTPRSARRHRHYRLR